MPFVTQIQCRRTKSLLASFLHFGNRYYVLAGGLHLPLRSTHTWCKSCSNFTEREDLYSTTEIQSKIDKLLADESEWKEIDHRHRKKYRMTDRELPESLTQTSIHKLWVAAKQWRIDRRASDRCLACFDACEFVDLGDAEPIRHPDNSGIMLMITSCHASVGNYPPIELFDPEGRPISPPNAV